MAGAIACTRRQLDSHPDLKAKVDPEELDKVIPVNVKF